MATSLAAQMETDERDGFRATLFLAAALRFSGRTVQARLRDLSQSGARVEGTGLPAPNTAVTIERGAMVAPGRVMWREAGQCGVRFDEVLDLRAWLPARERARTQDDIDRMIAQVRDETFRGRQNSPGPELTIGPSKQLGARLADEVAYVGRMLASLDEAVAGEPLMICRYGAQLQYLDLSQQVLRLVEALLRDPDPEMAIKQIGDVAFRRRLMPAAL